MRWYIQRCCDQLENRMRVGLCFSQDPITADKNFCKTPCALHHIRISEREMHCSTAWAVKLSTEPASVSKTWWNMVYLFKLRRSLSRLPPSCNSSAALDTLVWFNISHLYHIVGSELKHFSYSQQLSMYDEHSGRPKCHNSGLHQYIHSKPAEWPN